jgi:ketol-acid reductoisomerase
LKIYFDEDTDLKYLEEKTVAVIGYGIQGRAQALNMRDSKVNVIVGLRPEGESWKLAEKDGFKPYSIPEAAEEGDIIHILTPDMVQPSIYKAYIAKYLRKGKVLGFSHGFNIHYKQIIPPSDIDVIMVAPKSPGARLREMYLQGFGVPALLAVAQDVSGNAKNIALAMAKALGCTKAGVIETTFKDETESDLIGEQTVLIGGLMELIKKGFEVLVEAGYPPELSFFEACNEAKLIMDLIYEKGLTGMLRGVSKTARYGGLTIGPKVIDDHVKENMKKVVKEVQSGKFAEEWIKTSKENPNILEEKIALIENHELELVGKKIRKMSGIEK